MLITIFVSSFLWILTTFFFNQQDNGVVYPLIIGLMAGLLFLFKYTRSLELIGLTMAVLVFCILIPATHNSGGFYSDDILWMILAPFLAFLIGGRRIGLLASLGYFVVISYFYYLEINAETSYYHTALKSDPQYYYTSIILLGIFVLSILWIYESEKTGLVNKINENRKELEKQKEILEEEVADRTKSLRISNDSLQRSNKDLEQFAYIASHDLQEPLRMVGNFVQLLEEEYKDKLEGEGLQYIEFAVNGVERMSNLIEDLLNYSRAGKKELPLEHCDIQNLLEEKKGDLSLIINRRSAEIFARNMPSIYCYKNYLSIIFHNLITNGLKYNQSPNPRIDIDHVETETHHVFSVKDNGIGINMEYKEQIFEIFKRLHRKEEFSGTGIGLAIVQKLVHYHKGEIWLESEEGEGTTFYFSVYKHLNRVEL